MQIHYFQPGAGYVAHKYRVPGLASKFSVWFNEDGIAIDAERIDRLNRAHPVYEDSPAWRYIARHRIAGHENATAVAAKRRATNV